MTKTFSEILNDQLEFHQSEIPDWNHVHATSGLIDSSCLSDLISVGFHIDLRTSARVYPMKKQNHQTPPPPPQPPVEKKYLLSVMQTAALEHINCALPPLEKLHGEFSALDLKRAFRKASKIYHPDHGGSPTLFIELGRCVKILLDFLNSIK
jgi:hypothetical protein